MSFSVGFVGAIASKTGFVYGMFLLVLLDLLLVLFVTGFNGQAYKTMGEQEDS